MIARTLIESPNMLVRRFEHRCDNFRPEDEVCEHIAVNFVDSGEFEVASADRKWTLRAGDALVCCAQTERTYMHREATPSDVCVSVVFKGAIAADIERGGWWSGVAMASNRRAFLRWQLDRIATSGDVLQLEEWSSALADAMRDTTSSRCFRSSQLAWYAERIDSARREIETHYSRSHSLTSLAREAGMSPFHFARTFRDLVGTPPHQYLRNVRLVRAAERLRDGEAVTATCYEVGFANLSHFIRSFRRRYGCVPSEIRKKVQAAKESQPA